jgi:imidazolonepropionase
MLLNGTTTIEAKSGYGLNLDDEIKQLVVLKEIDTVHPVEIVSTFMGAHEVPPEYRSKKKAYIQFLTERVMPEIKKKKLAEFFDVFCEDGVFSIQESRHLIQAAKKAGFKIKIHADEFSPLGGAELAVSEEALSAEHLIAVSKSGIQKLANSSTAAVLLPGVSFFLMQDQKAPARELIDRGAIIAMATDYNPGSSMTDSMLFVLRLGVFTLKMSLEEAIHATTANAAYAIDRHKQIGSIEPGKKMDVVLWEVPNYAHLVYHMSGNPIKHVIKNGKIVVENGKRVASRPK